MPLNETTKLQGRNHCLALKLLVTQKYYFSIIELSIGVRLNSKNHNSQAGVNCKTKSVVVKKLKIYKWNPQ